MIASRFKTFFGLLLIVLIAFNANLFAQKKAEPVAPISLSKDGKLVYHGAIDDNPQDASAVSRKHLKEAINEVVSGKDVSVKTSRSIGCTIKRKA